MSADEFLSLFPSSKPNFNSRPELGAISYLVVDQSENPAFANDERRIIGNWFLDGRMNYIAVEYSEFEPRNISDFITQVAVKLELPPTGWRVDRGVNADLNCNGFTVSVGRDQFKLGEGPPWVSLSDDVAQARFLSRDKEARQKEAEDLRRKVQERGVFKP